MSASERERASRRLPSRRGGDSRRGVQAGERVASLGAGGKTQRTSYKSVFAIGEFRVLFAGMLVYILGFGFEILGLSVLVYAQTRSAFLTALAFSMGFAPQAVGGLLFTSLADRLPSRTVITTGLLIRAAPGVLIGLLPSMPVALMLALIAVTAMTSPVYNAAISGMLPEVLDGDRYVLGRSILNLTSSGTQILSLGIGGAILVLLPARRLLLVAGCALVLSALIRLGLRPRPARVAAGARAGIRGTVRSTMTGNTRLFADPAVRGLLLAQWLPSWFVTGAESLVVPYTEALGHPASAASPMLAAVPAGMLVGDVVVGRFCRESTRYRLVFPLALLLGVPLVALVAPLPLLVVGLLLFATGLGFGYQLGIQRPFLDAVPPSLRGQAFGLNTTGLMGGQGLVPSLIGAVAVATGAGGAIALAGCATILVVLSLRRVLASSASRRRSSR
jgi:MFS family permease